MTILRGGSNAFSGGVWGAFQIVHWQLGDIFPKLFLRIFTINITKLGWLISVWIYYLILITLEVMVHCRSSVWEIYLFCNLFSDFTSSIQSYMFDCLNIYNTLSGSNRNFKFQWLCTPTLFSFQYVNIWIDLKNIYIKKINRQQQSYEK